MKHILSLLLLLFLSVSGVSGKVADSAGIARFWNEYHELMLKNADCSGYWYTKNNLVERSFIPRDRYLPHKIESITTFNDSVCIITLSLNKRPRNWYKVGVLRQKDGYRLVDYFELTKGGLNHVKTGYADIYSPRLKFTGGRRIDNFIGEFCGFYGFEPESRIAYFKCRDLEECFHLAGLGFDRSWGFILSKGYTIFGTLVFTKEKCHRHEIIHAIMASKYPDASPVLHEGIAVYHSNDRKKIRRFQSYVDRGGSLEGIENGYYRYAVGALVIDHALKNYGRDKMLGLFAYRSFDEALEKEFGVLSGGKDDFILSLLREYRLNGSLSKNHLFSPQRQ